MRYHVRLRLHFGDGTTREGTYVGLGSNRDAAILDAMQDAWDAFEEVWMAGPEMISVVSSELTHSTERV